MYKWFVDNYVGRGGTQR